MAAIVFSASVAPPAFTQSIAGARRDKVLNSWGGVLRGSTVALGSARPRETRKLDVIVALAALPEGVPVPAEKPIVQSDAGASTRTITAPWTHILVEIGQVALLFVGVIVARWVLRRTYRTAVLRHMRRQKQTARDPVPALRSGSESRIEFFDVQERVGERVGRASLANRAARRQALGRWASIVIAALVQDAALVLFGGVPLIENPGEPLLQIVLWQAQLALGAGFFLLAIMLPGLIRSGQTSAVSWWLFAAPIGMLAAVVPGVFVESHVTSPLYLVFLFAVCVAVGYAILVGSLSAAFLAKRLLRLSPEAFASVLAGSVAAAINASVLVLETGTSLGWWALFAPAEVVILSAPYIVGRCTGQRGAPVALLFLRTFGNASRSDRLLRAVCRTWLTAGEIHAIVGPDIAASTASPDGVLRLATLRMGHHFICSPADLERRLRKSKRRPALDGRYEVREYPCVDSTWRPTMQRLAAMVDAILVDVRGYTAANVGTAFELATLGELRALERTLLIVDDSTPIESVRAAIRAGSTDGRVGSFRGFRPQEPPRGRPCPVFPHRASITEYAIALQGRFTHRAVLFAQTRVSYAHPSRPVDDLATRHQCCELPCHK